jgi:Chemotaxis signal transduction protein
MSEHLNDKYLIFEVDEYYAVEIAAVVEIIEYSVPTNVPDTPDYIAGMMNLHGHIVPVIDIRTRFRKKPKDITARKCIIIVNINHNQLGLIVDNVMDLITIDPANLTAPPQVGTSYSYVFIKSIGISDKKMHLVIDTDKLINHKDLEIMESAEDTGDGHA